MYHEAKGGSSGGLGSRNCRGILYTIYPIIQFMYRSTLPLQGDDYGTANTGEVKDTICFLVTESEDPWMVIAPHVFFVCLFFSF